MNRPRKQGYHFLPMGMYNNSIPFEFYQALDIYQKPRWRRIDIQKTFNLDIPVDPALENTNDFVQIGIDSNIPRDVIKISQERKLFLSDKSEVK